MISASDVVQLAYTPDLTDAGLVYARRLLPSLPLPSWRGLHVTFRRTIAATAAQLAFRRYLTEQGLPFGIRSSAPFPDPELYETQIGGRTCVLKSFLISRPSQVEALSVDPSLALEAPALVPADRHAAEGLREDDLYVFAIVSAVAAERRTAAEPATPVEGSEFWLHGMPVGWRRPRAWAPLGSLALKSDSPAEFSIEIAGEDSSRVPSEMTVELSPGRRVVVDTPFYAVSHLHAATWPGGQVGIHSLSREATHVVPAADWHNVWLQGKAIYLLGWITREQFRMLARVVPEGRSVFQFTRTKTKNLAVDANCLKPVHQLIERVRDGKYRSALHSPV